MKSILETCQMSRYRNDICPNSSFSTNVNLRIGKRMMSGIIPFVTTFQKLAIKSDLLLVQQECTVACVI